MPGKRFLFITATVLIHLAACLSPVQGISREDLQAKAALLMEYHTGEIITSLNQDKKVYPASITKIMTMLIALDALATGDISLDNEVPITERAASMGGSQLFLSPGDVIDMESLLIGIVVGSGNDASVAVAEYIAGSEEAFVERMNERAKKMGMENTNFVNTSGLHHEDHYSTTYDLALMSRELLSYPIFFRWSQIWMDENFLEGRIRAGRVYLSNTNRLIRYYDGCDGIKTGFTGESGHSISATASRNGTRLIAIVMGAPASDIRYQEAKQLLDYGFSNYQGLVLIPRNQVVSTLPVDRGSVLQADIIALESLSLMTKIGDEVEYEIEYHLPERLEAPAEKGSRVGTVVALHEKDVVKEIDLVLADDLRKASFPELLQRYFQIWLRFAN